MLNMLTSAAMMTPSSALKSEEHCSCPAMMRAAGGQAPAPTVDLVQRSIALRCLSGACENGQLLVDIFVNYDCDLEGANLFERLVLALVRTAQAPPAADSPAIAADEAHLRLLASLPHSFLSLTPQEGLMSAQSVPWTFFLQVRPVSVSFTAQPIQCLTC